MKDRRQVWLAAAFMVAFAITRWPGLMPPNFSAVYALMFCAGVFYRGRTGWWLPLVFIGVTDLLLNCYYYFGKGIQAFQFYQLLNYPAYVVLIWLGRKFDARASMAKLVAGSLLGAILFYIVTNTASWLFNPFGNPEYVTKTLATLFIALTKGAGSWPQTWEFFRNTLMSAGLFTALFSAAYKYSAHLESAAEKKAANATEDSEETEAEPEEASAWKIGVISDTHNLLDPRVFEIFRGVEHILHAGDIGRRDLLAELETIAPVTAVGGNTDNDPTYKETAIVTLESRKFLIHHIVTPGEFNRPISRRIASEEPDVVVFGHTHKPYAQQFGRTLFFNPGSAGQARFGLPRSVALMECGPEEIRHKMVWL